MIGVAAVERKACNVYYGDGCHTARTLEQDAMSLSLDPYIVDSLLPDLVGHDRQPSAFLVYLMLWKMTHGGGAAAMSVQVALRDLAEATGLSKRSVQSALAWLMKRKLVDVTRASVTAVPVYTVLRPWRRHH